MMEPFFSQIEKEREKFIWNIMSLLEITPKSHDEMSNKLFTQCLSK
jgi:hypothetical protein